MWTDVAPTGETGIMQGCKGFDCAWEERNEIDHYDREYGDLNVCELLYPDKVGLGW